MKGTIKWFNPQKGFGFIKSEDGGNDIFFHYSALKMTGFKTIQDGTEVEFDLVDGEKGVQASDVTKI